MVTAVPQIEREGLSVGEAAHALGVGRVTVFKMFSEGKLRRVKIGARTIVPRSEIARILNGNDHNAE